MSYCPVLARAHFYYYYYITYILWIMHSIRIFDAHPIHYISTLIFMAIDWIFNVILKTIFENTLKFTAGSQTGQQPFTGLSLVFLTLLWIYTLWILSSTPWKENYVRYMRNVKYFVSILYCLGVAFMMWWIFLCKINTY